MIYISLVSWNLELGCLDQLFAYFYTFLHEYDLLDDASVI